MRSVVQRTFYDKSYLMRYFDEPSVASVGIQHMENYIYSNHQ